MIKDTKVRNKGHDLSCEMTFSYGWRKCRNWTCEKQSMSVWRTILRKQARNDLVCICTIIHLKIYEYLRNKNILVNKQFEWIRLKSLGPTNVLKNKSGWGLTVLLSPVAFSSVMNYFFSPKTNMYLKLSSAAERRSLSFIFSRKQDEDKNTTHPVKSGGTLICYIDK